MIDAIYVPMISNKLIAILIIGKMPLNAKEQKNERLESISGCPQQSHPKVSCFSQI